MRVETIKDINIKRKNLISFLLNNPGLPSNIIDLCLAYIDALTNEQDIMLTLLENELLRYDMHYLP